MEGAVLVGETERVGEYRMIDKWWRERERERDARERKRQICRNEII